MTIRERKEKPTYIAQSCKKEIRNSTPKNVWLDYLERTIKKVGQRLKEAK
jgi:hypothetical protein